MRQDLQVAILPLAAHAMIAFRAANRIKCVLCGPIRSVTAAIRRRQDEQTTTILRRGSVPARIHSHDTRFNRNSHIAHNLQTWSQYAVLGIEARGLAKGARLRNHSRAILFERLPCYLMKSSRLT